MATNIRPYTSKSGASLFKPSLDLLQELDVDNMGFCLACGDSAEGVEPDARQYTCECCGNRKVYGAAELALMGLYYTE